MLNVVTKIRAYSFLSLQFLLLLTVSAQQRFSRYGVNEGLSQSSVYAIFQDSYGYMWFGTGDGLNRFDGQHFEIFKHQPGRANGLRSSFITLRMLEDDAGNLWVATRGGGISRFIYNEKRFEWVIPHGFDSSDMEIDIELIDTDKGKLWFWLGYNTLACMDIGSYHCDLFHMPVELHMQPYSSNRQGLIMDNNIFFTGNGRVNVFSIAQKKFGGMPDKEKRILESEYAVTLYKSEDNILWIGARHSLLRYDRTKQSISRIDLGQTDSLVDYVIQPDAENHMLWIGTLHNGLICYHLNNGKKEVFRLNEEDPHSLSFNITRSIFIDRSKNLWVGTDGGGVNRLDLKPQKFRHLAKGTFVKCFFEDGNNTLWVGTHKQGIMYMDLASGEMQPKKHKIMKEEALSVIMRDVKGNILIGAENGAGYLQQNQVSGKIPYFPEVKYEVKENAVFDLLNTREGTTLAATRLGLFEGRYKNGKLDTFSDLYIHTLILSLCQTRDGRIWVAPMGATTIFVMQYVDGKLSITDSVLKSSNVRSFYEDKKNQLLWMGSEMGLIRYDLVSNSIKFLGTAQGLADNFVYGLLPDETGRLWLSTNKGISCYDPAKNTFRNYSVSDGLQSNEFNTGAFYRSSSGELFFGGVNGFNAFFPSKLRDNPYPPQVVLTSLKINDGDVNWNIPAGGSMQLPHDSSTFSFEFAALEFTNPAKNIYRYRLDGWDNAWVFSGSTRFAHYGNLPPGNYTLYVQAANNDGLWNTPVNLLHINIRPPFWQTGLFIVLASLCGLGLFAYSIRHLSTRKLRQQLRELEKFQAVQKERERISKDMHDDLGSGLSRIAIQSELLKYKLKNKDNPELHAEKIIHASRELVDNLGEIVWALNARHDSLESLFSYLRHFAQELFEDTEMNCIVEFPEQVPHIQLNSELRRNIYLVMKEALNNALKYAGACGVKLEAQLKDRELTLTVSDEGKGFDRSQARELGNGLLNMLRRAESIGATFELHSKPGQGTRIQLKIQL